MMFKGSVDGIYISRAAKAPAEAVTQVQAIPGKGLEGDRYFKGEGTFSPTPGTGREVTLIEMEAIEALKNDYEYELAPGDSRRNLVTRGVPLNHLIGQEFMVGEVRLRGMRLCDPCQHLAALTNRRALTGLIHRGGLRAEIVVGGIIHTGDVIEWHEHP